MVEVESLWCEIVIDTIMVDFTDERARIINKVVDIYLLSKSHKEIEQSISNLNLRDIFERSSDIGDTDDAMD